MNQKLRTVSSLLVLVACLVALVGAVGPSPAAVAEQASVIADPPDTESHVFLPIIFNNFLDRACGVWPLSFYQERWNQLDCWRDGDPEDAGVFYLFNDGSFEEDDPCFDEFDGECYPACDVLGADGVSVVQEGACSCGLIPPDDDAFIMGPDHRGWLMFPTPEKPFDDPLDCTSSCGNQVRCWIESGGYTGEVRLPGYEEVLCLNGQTGVDESVRIEIERNQIGATPNILLWNRECSEGEPVAGECSGIPYHIVGIGCLEILDVFEVTLYHQEPFDPTTKCVPNVKTIKARRLCSCASKCSSAGPGN